MDCVGKEVEGKLNVFFLRQIHEFETVKGLDKGKGGL